MMKIPSLSVLVSLSVMSMVLSQQASCASVTVEHPLVDYVIVRPQIKFPLEKALEQLRLDPETADVETINRAILEASKTADDNSRYVYQALVEILNKTENYIPRQTVAYSVLIQALEEFEPYRKFVEQGRERVLACSDRLTLDKINYWLEKFEIGPDFFGSLREFFQAALDHESPDDDDDDEGYLERLKRLNLETDKVNVEQMKQVARGKELDFVQLQPGVSRTIENFLTDRCTFYYKTLFSQMNLINLSQSLGHGPFDAKLQEYNEYNRICVAWHKQSGRAKIMRNILGGQQ